MAGSERPLILACITPPTNFGLHNTSHYVAPTVAWSPGHELTFRLSPTFGLTDTSARFLLRVGVSYEIDGFGPAVARFFRGLGR